MMITNTVVVKTEEPGLTLTRAHPSDAGADLRSKESVSIYPNEQKVVNTGISIKIPKGYVGLVFSRSSLGKHGVTLSNSVGVIDSDYRGEIKVLLKNSGHDVFNINKFDRVAQLVILPIVLPDFLEFSGEEDEWLDTNRGEGGFGSSGRQ